MEIGFFWCSCLCFLQEIPSTLFDSVVPKVVKKKVLEFVLMVAVLVLLVLQVE